MTSISWARQLREDATRFGDSVAARDNDRVLTFNDRAGLAGALAHRLLAKGVQPGEPVACLLRNGTEVIWAAAGISATGAAEMVLDPALGEDDLTYVCGLAGVSLVVTDAAQAPRFERLGIKTLDVASVESAELHRLDELPRIEGATWGKLMFTSGTTGRPKGVVHSHERRWIANLLLRTNLPFVPGPDDRILLMTPFAHGSGLLTGAYLDYGASVEMMHGIDVERIDHLLRRNQVNAIFAPPTVLAKITAALRGSRFDHVRCVFTGTATLLPDLYEAAAEMFGPKIRITYGMTEIFNPITTLQPDATHELYSGANGQQPGSCLGWPATCVDIRIVDEEGKPLAAGEIGDVLVHAPQMFLGNIGPDGFVPLAEGAFHETGDMGYLDERGRLYLTGRRRDMIKTGGYKIFPEEIERVLGADVTVLGFPSDYWGEIAVAVTEGSDETWTPVDEKMKSMTGYKRPRAYLCVPTLPRNGQGKVVRATLREMIASRYHMNDGPYPEFTPI